MTEQVIAEQAAELRRLRAELVLMEALEDTLRRQIARVDPTNPYAAGSEAPAGCCCPLRETTTALQRARGEFSFERGRPDGCPVHETAERRAQRIDYERRRAAAMKAARLAPANPAATQ